MDVSQINKLADFSKIMHHYNFRHINESGDKIRACCKLHDGNKPTSFEVDTNKGLWYCHSTCKTGGNAINLVMQLEGCDFYTACNIVAEISGFKLDKINFNKSDIEDAEKLKSWFDGLKPKTISFDKYRLSNYPARSIKEYRGLDKSTLDDARVSFYPIYPLEEEKRLYNRIAFPLIIKNTLVGVSLRATNVGEVVKWVHLPRGFKKGHFLYNYDECLSYIGKSRIYEVIVVEGILDCLKMKQAGIHNVVAVLGTSISAGQLTLLMKMATSITLCFDADEAGVKSREKYVKELKNLFDIFYMDLDWGLDPHSHTEDRLNELYSNKIKC